jgi:4-diphosphocytidyl-2-C-methyl-D-erythritol kinase
MSLRIVAPAKVNLYIAVGAVGDDGYHAVDTVLQALMFGDTVTIDEGVPFSFSCTPDLGLDPEGNLALRAARAMSAHFGHPLDVSIIVDKQVPAGAGLGGASADAAAVVCGLAAIWGVGEATRDLQVIAGSLGADVPFFLRGGAALFGGRGDVPVRHLQPLDAPVVLVKPAEAVPTAAAYAAFDLIGGAEAPALQPLIDALEADDRAGVGTRLFNAMTAASLTLVPAVTDAMRLVEESPGVVGAAMAGSGSAVFGICEDTTSAQACADSARLGGFWATATRTRPDGCRIEHV